MVSAEKWGGHATISPPDSSRAGGRFDAFL